MKNIRPIIGIIGTPSNDSENFETVALYEAYRKMAIMKDFIIFMITPYKDINYSETKREDMPPLTDQEKEIYEEMLNMCDGLIIPGGYGIYDYHEFIVNLAIEKNMPVLGTCLGMQILGIMDNKDVKLLEDESGLHKQRGEKYAHGINIVDNTLLSKIIGDKNIKVNSVHKYYLPDVKNYVVSAYSEDGIIEAIENPNKNFVLGLQWHPEKMVDYDKNANKIIDRFIDESIKYKSSKSDIDIKLTVK